MYCIYLFSYTYIDRLCYRHGYGYKEMILDLGVDRLVLRRLYRYSFAQRRETGLVRAMRFADFQMEQSRYQSMQLLWIGTPKKNLAIETPVVCWEIS